MSKKKIYFILVLITVFAFIIRFTALDKPEGIWNDEYISWFIASKPFSGDFLNAVYKNCHMPLYYFYLKIWMFFFGNSDFLLRISSLVPGIFALVVMFFVGREIKDDKTGLFCAALTALSGFMIYFSQEIRFYSLMFLFSALCVLFFLKLLQKQSYLNYAIFALCNFLIMLTHTIGFVFVFFNFLFLFTYLKMFNKITTKQIIAIVLPIVIAMLPFVPFMYKVMTGSYISQFWSDFSFTKLFFVFADYVSPIQINLINTPINVSTLLFKNGKLNLGYCIFALIPFLISWFAIVTAVLKKNVKLLLLLSVGLCTLIIMIIASSFGKIVLITKYTTEIYPAFIAAFAFGLVSVKNDFLRKILAGGYCLLVITYLFVSDYAPQKLKRPEGHAIAAQLINDANLSRNDNILILYYDKNRFGKYINLDKYNFSSITKYDFQYRMMLNPPAHIDIIKQGKNIFYEKFKSGENNVLNEALYYDFFEKLQKGQKFALLTLDSVAFIDEERMKSVTASPDFYKRMPLLFLVFSHLENGIIKYSNSQLKPVFYETKGKWAIYVWEKT